MFCGIQIYRARLFGGLLGCESYLRVVVKHGSPGVEAREARLERGKGVGQTARVGEGEEGGARGGAVHGRGRAQPDLEPFAIPVDPGEGGRRGPSELVHSCSLGREGTGDVRVLG
jgi:hypothetical protein